MPRYEVVVEIRWTGISGFPVYLEAANPVDALRIARQGDYSDERPADGSLEIAEVKVEAVQDER